MDTDSFVPSFPECKIYDSHMALSNLDIHVKIINRVPSKIKHEYGRKPVKKFFTLLPKTYSFKIIMLKGRNKEY